MEGNVFLVDSRYLNKIILAAGQNQVFSNYEEGSNETETYGIQIIEPNSEDDEDILSTVEVADENISNNLLHPMIDGESHMFVPCVEDSTPKTETNIKSFLGCETFVADLKSESNEEICEQIQNSNETGFIQANMKSECNTSSVPTKASPNLMSKIDRSFCLRKSKLMLSTCYRNNYNKTKYLPRVSGYSEERYSIYSGTKSSLRYHGISDNIIMIPPNLFKRQLTDVSDTMKPLLRMPSTRQGMRVLDLTVTKLFSQPAAHRGGRLARSFTRNCSTFPESDCVDTNELGLLPVGYQPPIDRSKIKRITRKRKNPEDKQSQLLQKMLQLSATPRKDNDNGSAFSNNIPTEYLTIEEPVVEWVTEDGCYILSGEYEGMEEDSQQIIIIHDEQDQEQPEQEHPEQSGHHSIGHSNMEVLLAAAAEGHMSPGELFFCQESSEPEEEHEVMSSEQIILVSEEDGAEVIIPD